MKTALFFVVFLSALFSFARQAVDFKQIHSQAHQEMDKVLQDNPQVYETKPIMRKPASAKPVRGTTEKLDEIERQADTHISW